MVAFYVPIGLVTAPKPILAFTDSATSSSQGGTSRTYAVSFGSGHPTRYMIVMWAMKNASGSYSCTVGGVSTSLIMNSTLGQQIFNIWIAPLPTGSSGNVIVSGSIADITVIGVYSLTFEIHAADNRDHTYQPGTIHYRSRKRGSSFWYWQLRFWINELVWRRNARF